MVFLISSTVATINLNTSLSQFMQIQAYIVFKPWVRLVSREDIVEVIWCYLLDPGECHLQYYDLRHSLNDFFFLFFENQQN